MSGIPEFNFPAFFRAQEMLEKFGWQVWNPANKGLEKTLDRTAYQRGDQILAVKVGFDFRGAFLWDVTKIIQGHGIYMLRGWEHSPGATAEHRVACAMKKHYPEYELHYEV